MLAARGVRLPQPRFDATDAELLRFADDGGLLNVRPLALMWEMASLHHVMHMSLL